MACLALCECELSDLFVLLIDGGIKGIRVR